MIADPRDNVSGCQGYCNTKRLSSKSLQFAAASQDWQVRFVSRMAKQSKFILEWRPVLTLREKKVRGARARRVRGAKVCALKSGHRTSGVTPSARSSYASGQVARTAPPATTISPLARSQVDPTARPQGPCATRAAPRRCVVGMSGHDGSAGIIFRMNG